MARVTVEDCLKTQKLFELVILSAKRARQADARQRSQCHGTMTNPPLSHYAKLRWLY